MDLTAGIGIRFDRDEAANSNVKMGTISVQGASVSHSLSLMQLTLVILS